MLFSLVNSEYVSYQNKTEWYISLNTTESILIMLIPIIHDFIDCWIILFSTSPTVDTELVDELLEEFIICFLLKIKIYV